MPIQSLQCPLPIRHRIPVAARDYAQRDAAIALYEEGRYRDAVCETLTWMLPGWSIPEQLGEPFYFVQGSARVRVRIEDEELVLTTALAALRSDSQATALLRFVLSRLSSTGQLFQPRLRGDTLSLEFRDPLPLLHPQKLIEALQRLPMEADANDAWMVERFGVDMVDREAVAALSDEEFERALALWEQHWISVEELMAESRRRRQVRFLDAVGAFAVNQVRYTLPLFGAVRAQLNESAEDFTDRDEHPSKRDSALAKCIKEMRKTGADALRPCLGHARYAINPLQEGTPSLLTSVLGGGHSMQTTGELRAAGRSMEAALELIADYLYLLAYQSWPSEVEAALRHGLDLVSGKPWREAADQLWNHANATARVFGSHSQNDRDDASPLPPPEHAEEPYQ